MTFVMVVFSVIVDRLFEFLGDWRSHQWFSGYFHLLGEKLLGINMLSGTLGVIVVALVPVTAVLIVLWILNEISTLLPFAGAFIVLVMTLGPRELHGEITAYIAAVEDKDEQRATAAAERIIGATPPAEEAERCHAVIRGVLVNANDRLFAVIFWFSLLGPLGAVFFRGAELLRHGLAEEYGEDSEFADAANRLHGILAWLPARLLAGSYALAGSFEEAVTDWRAYYDNCSARFFEINNDILGCSGAGAVRLAAASRGAEMEYLHATANLLNRATVIWLASLALLTLSGFF
ncbi:MAG: regulatory signaling modulator protein AmpE [Gammaproteobacteria bacterium]|nr:regulatory signaling modulator protein AmpE [Gammaproteobacteria bacterium]